MDDEPARKHGREWDAWSVWNIEILLGGYPRVLRGPQRRPVRVPSAVLLELYRGTGHDEPIVRILRRGFARVVTTGVRWLGAGHLLAEAGRGSEMAVDALAWRPRFASVAG